jgi:hypothetical protein
MSCAQNVGRRLITIKLNTNRPVIGSMLASKMETTAEKIYVDWISVCPKCNSRRTGTDPKGGHRIRYCCGKEIRTKIIRQYSRT